MSDEIEAKYNYCSYFNGRANGYDSGMFISSVKECEDCSVRADEYSFDMRICPSCGEKMSEIVARWIYTNKRFFKRLSGALDSRDGFWQKKPNPN